MIRAPKSLVVVRPVEALQRFDWPPHIQWMCGARAVLKHAYADNSSAFLMKKKPFTTRLDPAVLEVAEQLAAAERRSVTSLIEIAIIEYAKQQGFKAITEED